MSKRTPGDWKISSIDDCKVISQDGSDRTWVATCRTYEDALLFAASPDLLEACKQAVQVFPDQMRGSLIEVAVARAEGKET